MLPGVIIFPGFIWNKIARLYSKKKGDDSDFFWRFRRTETVAVPCDLGVEPMIKREVFFFFLWETSRRWSNVSRNECHLIMFKTEKKSYRTRETRRSFSLAKFQIGSSRDHRRYYFADTPRKIRKPSSRGGNDYL